MNRARYTLIVRLRLQLRLQAHANVELHCMYLTRNLAFMFEGAAQEVVAAAVNIAMLMLKSMLDLLSQINKPEKRAVDCSTLGKRLID